MVMNKNEVYFLVLKTGEVYQARYMGVHAETSVCWFHPLYFESAACGPIWVHSENIAVATSLGDPDRTYDFNRALQAILK